MATILTLFKALLYLTNNYTTRGMYFGSERVNSDSVSPNDCLRAVLTITGAHRVSGGPWFEDPSKYETSNQCWFNVGASSATLVQY